MSGLDIASSNALASDYMHEHPSSSKVSLRGEEDDQAFNNHAWSPRSTLDSYIKPCSRTTTLDTDRSSSARLGANMALRDGVQYPNSANLEARRTRAGLAVCTVQIPSPCYSRIGSVSDSIQF